MKKTSLLFILSQQVFCMAAQTKIIDMHVHSYSSSDFEVREPGADFYEKKGSKDEATQDLHLQRIQ